MVEESRKGDTVILEAADIYIIHIALMLDYNRVICVGIILCTMCF